MNAIDANLIHIANKKNEMEDAVQKIDFGSRVSNKESA